MSSSGGSPGPYSANASGSTTPGSSSTVAALLYVNNGTGAWNPVTRGQSVLDADTGGDSVPVVNGVWNGASYDRVRTPVVFKRVATAASGDTAVWTPGAGKKFRLMKFRLEITGQATIGGGATMTALLRDATTSLEVGGAWFLPAAAGTTLTQISTPWIDLGNGALSSAANNVLNVNLSLALATGSLVTWAAGTEE